VLTPGNWPTYDRLGNPRFSNGNATAPSCVDMNRKTRPRPPLRERQARFRRAVRNHPVVLALTDGSRGKREVGVRGFGRAGGERRQHGRVSV
jgi:hypothetical protein